jgi:hypothetical protein
MSMSARRFLALCAIAVPLVVGSAPANAQAAFNGTWSVLIVTEKGSCDRAYRYPIRVTNGRVSYAGQADFNMNGKVTPNGTVNVTVSRGAQRANGSGRLFGRSGSGSWRGGGSQAECSGSWTAEKRGEG